MLQSGAQGGRARAVRPVHSYPKAPLRASRDHVDFRNDCSKERALWGKSWKEGDQKESLLRKRSHRFTKTLAEDGTANRLRGSQDGKR